jgi:hypothetical protein
MLNMTWKKLLSIAGAIVLLASLTGGAIKVTEKFATAESVRQNSLQIKKDRLKDDIRWYQDQMRYLLDKYNVRNCMQLPREAFNSYQQYQDNKTLLERELNGLMGK